MKKQDQALKEFKQWYEQLPVYASSGGPAKGSIAGALVVLEHLKESFDLRIEAHTAKGGSQVSGASGSAVKRILAQFGETRRFVSEGGRTNRGLRGAIIAMLATIKDMELDKDDAEQRNRILTAFQGFLVEKVAEFHGRQRLKVVYEPSKSAWQSIHDLLQAAREAGKAGPVAEYLIGAKLQLRFPELEIRNEPYSAADEQSNLPGDFVVGDTTFHVTVAPMLPLFEKCKRNLESGRRVYLLVPDDVAHVTRATAEDACPGRITVSSVEAFVSQNVEEISVFSEDQLARGFFRLLTTYNQRVGDVEVDRSMLIEIPENLLRYAAEEEDRGIDDQ